MTRSPPSDHFEARAAEYSRHVAPLFADLYARVADDVGRGRPARVLDVGCGDGRLVEILADQGHPVVGLDRSSALLALAAGRVPGARTVAFVRGVAECLPFADDTFDVTCCLMSLPHFDDAPRAVAELSRVTAPSGRIYAASFAGAVRDRRPVAQSPGLQGLLRAVGLAIERSDLVCIEAGVEDPRELAALFAGATEPLAHGLASPPGASSRGLRIYFQVLSARPERRLS